MRVVDSSPLTWDDWALAEADHVWRYAGKCTLESAQTCTHFDGDETQNCVDCIFSTLVEFVNTFTSKVFYDDFGASDSDAWRRIAGLAVTACEGIDMCSVVNLLCSKQRDYGPNNILKFGHKGIAVRLSDKISRLQTLRQRQSWFVPESAYDSFVDIVGYCIIALMLISGTFHLQMSQT